MVKVSEEVPFNGTLAEPKAFKIAGGATTSTLAEAVPPVPPSVDVTFEVVLFFVPPETPVTLMVNVHELFAAIIPPVRLMLLLPATAVIAPAPQEPVSPFGVDTTKPPGSVSVKPTPLSDCVVLPFWMVNCRVVVLFS